MVTVKGRIILEKGVCDADDGVTDDGSDGEDSDDDGIEEDKF